MSTVVTSIFHLFSPQTIFFRKARLYSDIVPKDIIYFRLHQHSYPSLLQHHYEATTYPDVGLGVVGKNTVHISFFASKLVTKPIAQLPG